MELLHEEEVLRVEPAPPERLAEAAELAGLAWDVPPRPGEILAEWVHGDDEVLVVVAIDPSGRLAGVTTATLVGRTRATSDETVVAPAWRGRGVARRLLDEMTRLLARRGVHIVEGQSSSERPESLGFFLRYGFRIVGTAITHQHPGFAEGTTIYLTRLDLSSSG